MTHKQSYIKVMLNKRRYSSEIAVFFNMSSVILHDTCKTTTPLVEATVNETLWYFSPLSDYRSLQ